MTVADWFSEPTNWVFLVLALVVVVSALRVVTSTNVVHSALFLVLALGGTAGLFLLLSAEFVAWVLVLVYIGAVIVLFLFGIMITRAPTGPNVEVDHRHRAPAAMAAFLMFIVTAGSALTAFGNREFTTPHIDVIAEVLGIEVDELAEQLRDGATIAEIAGEKTQEVIDAVLAEESVSIEYALRIGRLSDEEAEEARSAETERVTAMVNGEKGLGTGTSTELIGEQLLQRFVLPFEVVSFVLLAALIGGITLARKDASPAEEEAAEEVDA
jgi:NADH:ubiquinone oxidoreductase subunit 6 (subunit J)